MTRVNMSNPRPLLAVTAGLLGAACWGVSATITKVVLEQVPPVTLVLVQVAASVSCLWAIVIARRTCIPPLRSALRLSLPGVLQPGLAEAAFVVALCQTTVSTFVLLASTEVVLTLPLARLVLGERVRRARVALAGLTMAGIGLVTLGAPATAEQAVANSPLGLGLLLIASFLAALYDVLSRRAVVVTTDTWLLLTLHQTAGLMVLVVLGLASWVSSQTLPVSTMSLGAWGWAIGSGPVLYAFPFWLFLVALAGLGAGGASVFLGFIPLFGLLGAWAIFGEQLNAPESLGAALIIVASVGIGWLSTRSAARRMFSQEESV